MSVPGTGSGGPRKRSILERENKPPPFAKYFALASLPSSSIHEHEPNRSRLRPGSDNESPDLLSYSISPATTSSCSSPNYIFQDTLTSPRRGWYSCPTTPLAPVSMMHLSSHHEQQSSEASSSSEIPISYSERDQTTTKSSLPRTLHRIREESPHRSAASILLQRAHQRAQQMEKSAAAVEPTTRPATARSDSSPKVIRRVRSNLTDVESPKRRGFVANMDITGTIMTRRNSWHQGIQTAPHPTTAEEKEFPAKTCQRDETPQLTDEMCDIMLRQRFGVNLEDLSSPLDAWNCVQQCLHKLSDLVDSKQAPTHAGTSQLHGVQVPISQLGSHSSQPGTFAHSFGSSSSGASGIRRGAASDRERGRDGSNQPPSDGHPDDDPFQDDNPKRHSKGENDNQGFKYSCPFRKRNKIRFNIHDWNACAETPFTTFSTLKKHIRECHSREQKHKCPRCHEGFSTHEQMMSHLSQPKEVMCEVAKLPHSGTLDPEDGISSEVDSALAARKSPDKISSWAGLWRALFSDDVEIPEPDWEPPKVFEIHEVGSWFDSRRPDLETSIRDTVDQMLNNPAWQSWDMAAVAALIAEHTTAAVNQYLHEWLEQGKLIVRDRIRSSAAEPESPSTSISLSQLEEAAISAGQEHLLTLVTHRKRGTQSEMVCQDLSYPNPELQSPGQFERGWPAQHGAQFPAGFDVPTQSSAYGSHSFVTADASSYNGAQHHGMPMEMSDYSSFQQSGSMEVDSLDLNCDAARNSDPVRPPALMPQNGLNHGEHQSISYTAYHLPRSRDSGIDVPRSKAGSGRSSTDYELASRRNIS